MNIAEISAGVHKLIRGQNAFERRLKSFEIAVGRGDPRFCKPEHAKPDFDTDAFDAWLEAKGLPSVRTDARLAEWAA